MGDSGFFRVAMRCPLEFIKHSFVFFLTVMLSVVKIKSLPPKWLIVRRSEKDSFQQKHKKHEMKSLQKQNSDYLMIDNGWLRELFSWITSWIFLLNTSILQVVPKKRKCAFFSCLTTWSVPDTEPNIYRTLVRFDPYISLNCALRQSFNVAEIRMLITIILIWVQTTFAGCYLPSRTSTLHEPLMKHGRYHPHLFISIHIIWAQIDGLNSLSCSHHSLYDQRPTDRVVLNRSRNKRGARIDLREVMFNWVMGQVFMYPVTTHLPFF